MLLEQGPAAGPGLASMSPHVSRDKTLPDFGTLYEFNVAAMIRHQAEGGARILMGVTFTLGFPLPVATGGVVTLRFPLCVTLTFAPAERWVGHRARSLITGRGSMC